MNERYGRASSMDRRAFLGGAGAFSLLSLRPSLTQASGGSDDVLDVLVVGAGLAGLTAARDLISAGLSSFAVLEAQKRVGGRTLNHQLEGGFYSEAGGQWMGPGQTAVADLARQLGIGTFKSEYRGKSLYRMADARLAIDTHGKVDVDQALVDKADALAATVPSGQPWTAPRAEELDRMTLADWLAQQGVDDQERLTWQFSSVLAAGTAAANVSALYYLSMLNSAGGFQGLNAQKDGAQEARFVGGSQRLSEVMAEALGHKLYMGTPVTRIVDWDKPVTEVHTPKGIFRARQVIMAVNPALCGRIEFAPQLPPSRRELQRRWPAYAPMCKTAMVYEQPFWFDAGYNGQIADTSGPVIWSFDNSPPGQERGVINAFMRAAQMPRGEHAAGEMLANYYADSWGDDRFREPLEFHRHDWAQDEFSLTCVSPMPPGLLTSGLMPSLTEPCGALLWSGTETADIWNGYMDGAVRSGHKAALMALGRLSVERAG